MEREFTVAETAHIARLRELNNEAHDHLNSAVDAHQKGDAKGVERAHTRLNRCLRSVDVEHARMAAEGAQKDLDATATIQTSDGIAKSDGTANGRGSPLYYAGNAGIPGFLARARQGGRRS
jgi:hypothetical protein